MGTYTYEYSLGSEHIRVLTLLPGRPGALIRCSLEVLPAYTDLPQEYAYEALSYAWGCEAHKSLVFCDGRPLSVTRDLAVALWHLRQEDTPRRLWIDQICINQEDLDERAAQVKLMDFVYKHSTRVIIWLGPESTTTKLGMKFAQELTSAILAYRQNFPNREIPRDSLGKILTTSNFFVPDADAIEWTALSDLLSRRWFSRLWIVQEALLNDVVILQCGSNQFTWDILSDLRTALSDQPHITNVLCRCAEIKNTLYLIECLQTLRGTLGTGNLDALISVFSSQQATDSRDHIYTLLSLAKQSDRQVISPDYRKPAADVFVDFTRLMIQEHGRLTMLHCIGINMRSHLQLPSWVPDWTMMRLDLPGRRVHMKVDQFCATQSLQADKAFLGSGRILQVRGRCIDTLGSIASTMPSVHVSNRQEDIAKENSEFGRMLKAFLDDVTQMATLSASSASNVARARADVILSSTLCREQALDPRIFSLEEALKILYQMYACCNRAQLVYKLLEAIGEDFNSWEGPRDRLLPRVKHWRQATKLGWRLMRDVIKTPVVPFEASMGWNTFYQLQLIGNKIVKTTGGLLANVPEACQAGDVIAILYGWSTPFLVRPVPTGYLLIGDCYVFGIMRGEAIDRGIGIETTFALV